MSEEAQNWVSLLQVAAFMLAPFSNMTLSGADERTEVKKIFRWLKSFCVLYLSNIRKLVQGCCETLQSDSADRLDENGNPTAESILHHWNARHARHEIRYDEWIDLPYKLVPNTPLYTERNATFMLDDW